MDDLDAEWRPVCRPPEGSEREIFPVARPDGSLEPVAAERWLFHLLGLPHRAVHVGLFTPSGLVVLQRRSLDKRDYPGRWDMAVTGHVPREVNGLDPSYEAGALKEMAEEIGLRPDDLATCLEGGRLNSIPGAYTISTREDDRTPPLVDIEVIQLFVGRLTPAGLAALRPDPVELAGLLLCSREQSIALAQSAEAAPGLRESLRRFLA